MQTNTNKAHKSLSQKIECKDEPNIIPHEEIGTDISTLKSERNRTTQQIKRLVTRIPLLRIIYFSFSSIEGHIKIEIHLI